MNVLVYTGTGSSSESVRHALFSLRQILSPRYAVSTVTAEVLLKEPWLSTCALLVMPGGADIGYCSTLNGKGNSRISQYVKSGGRYLGFCAGGYYGSKRCEFEVGNKVLEVIGDRELGFFPGICRGCAFSGFVYNGKEGAKAARLQLASEDGLGKVIKVYYNGGGVFVRAPEFKDQGVEIIASYADEIAVEDGPGKAAVVYCKVGNGSVVLSGAHPEFAGVNLDKDAGGPDYEKVVDEIVEAEQDRFDFLKSCLLKLGLDVSNSAQVVPALTDLHLSASSERAMLELQTDLTSIIKKEDGVETIKADSDVFELISSSKAIESSNQVQPDDIASKIDNLGLSDQTTKPWRILLHQTKPPLADQTPKFVHTEYYDALKFYSEALETSGQFGEHLLYGEVVTSTNTILEKNFALLKELPTGFVFTATVQVSGRGRGSNVWVSPPGALMFSTCIRHPLQLASTAPVVFVQYIAALAIVEGIKSYGDGYENLPVRLKWPNDIYAENPTEIGEKFVKIGGILVNSSFADKEYLMVVGIGINLANAFPSVSLGQLVEAENIRRATKGKQALPRFTPERLLARILTVFENMHSTFCSRGFKPFEKLYYERWLHTDQVVTLEMEANARARVVGITTDYGLLKVEELGWEDRGTGKYIALQTDNNSFDFFRGLLKRKL